ncbi:hypothetical protein COT42_00205 [Candidatus Saganbacteria bacterium CG08_land_8_20_14_0_20_45_16]|uniref:Glycosyltransferase RgtA/B/C/D-like domain-containing protein n=1 Tax=Candidatus Saganbacteria bacterium CG08_land_8_20_14_0_20_45_16 TaxID=2014293 RepID=A0A2H0Y222_UNCSA|nr:MAG: hypothetical protein COT42_00205 [Candidatus Saganbacteria bacterium CG08_land_8_20_14_0_20_45_16]
MNKTKNLLLILIATSALLFFFKLGSFSLYDAAETTYGEFIKQIMLTSDWITMHFNSQIIFDKPPLYFWLARMFTILIDFNEWAIRLPAAIFGVLTVITTFLLGKVFYNKKVGLLSAIVLMTAFQFLIQSRIAELDVLLVFFITAGLYCFWQGKYKLMYFWLALGTLIKGIIAIAMPGFAIFLFLLFTKELKKLKELQLLQGFLIILAIGGPWYAAEWVLHGEKFTQFVLGFLFLSRFQGVVSGHPGPLYYYLPALLLGFFPWSHFIPYALVKTWKAATNRSQATKLPSHPAILTLCYIIPVFLVFSIAKTKLPNYILPIYPFLAIMVGKLWVDFQKSERHAMLISNIGLAIVVALVFIAAAIAGRQYSGSYEALMPQLQLLGTIIACGSLVSILFFIFKKYQLSFVTLPIMVFVMTAILTTQTLPAVEEYKGTKELAQRVSEVVGASLIAAYNVGNRPGIVFYNSKPIIYLETEKELVIFLKNKKGYCFTTIEEYNKLKKKPTALNKKGDLVVVY